MAQWTPNKGFAKSVARGVDSLYESYRVNLPFELCERLNKAKESAQRLGGNKGLTIFFGGAEFQIAPKGGRNGLMYILSNSDFTIDIRPKNKWALTVQYKSYGLWRMGAEGAREELIKIILNETRAVGEDWAKVSRIDCAFDFYAPDFSPEMSQGIKHNFVCKGGGKVSDEGQHSHFKEWGRGADVQTITLGAITRLQTTIYNKGNEIVERSGKTWMIDLWKGEGFTDEQSIHDVWRVELRFGKEYLDGHLGKDGRNLRHFDNIIENINGLLLQGLKQKRYCVDTGDKNRGRWPAHPLWTAVKDQIGHVDYEPKVGECIEMRGDELLNSLIAQIAGTVRAAVVLKGGKYCEKGEGGIIAAVRAHIITDNEHDLKVNRAIERYKNINQPA